ncbi:hypothetical protein ACHAXT_002250 [Thalassiosira profunda]
MLRWRLAIAILGISRRIHAADDTCTEDSPGILQQILDSSLGRPLRPSDLPPPTAFNGFDNFATVTLPSGMQQAVKSGKVTQINNVESVDVLADIAVLPQALNRSSVEEILQLLRAYNDWDDDPDTVDGMPTYEIFVENPTLYEPSLKYRDTNPQFMEARIALRQKLSAIMQPYLDNVITPLVHQRYPEACTSRGPARYCTPCYSLVRRYKHGQRQSHATHYDGHALVTVVVGLSGYDVDYRGGLYVSTGFGQKHYLNLTKGDAVIHQSSLLHGVKVLDRLDDPERTERWSWILWYRDSATCEDHGYEWFAKCSEEGNALCQQMHATKVGSIPGISNEESAKRVIELNELAARGGAAMSAVKIARAYLGNLPSPLQTNVTKAAEFYRIAMKSNDPDGYYGMAAYLLMKLNWRYSKKVSGKGDMWKDPVAFEAVRLLEAAAYLGHPYAAFNLGLAHTFGYGNHEAAMDYVLAGQWFEASGLPEGYAVASQQNKVAGDTAREGEMMQRAVQLGFSAPWRVEARQRVGSGGAGGVDLNLQWPPAQDGRVPMKF